MKPIVVTAGPSGGPRATLPPEMAEMFGALPPELVKAIMEKAKAEGLDLSGIFKGDGKEAPKPAPPWEKFGITEEDWNRIQYTKEVYGTFEGTTGDARLDEIMKNPDKILAEKAKALAEEAAALKEKAARMAKEAKEEDERTKYEREMKGFLDTLSPKAEAEKKDFSELLKGKSTIGKTIKTTITMGDAKSSATEAATAADPKSVKTITINIEQDSDIVKGNVQLNFDTEKVLKELWKKNPEEVIRMLGAEAILEKIGASKALEYFS